MSGFAGPLGAPVRADSGHRSHAPGSSHTASSCRPQNETRVGALSGGAPARHTRGAFMTTIATRIPVLLLAADPILRNGLRTTLQSRPELRVIDEDDSSPDTVVIVVTDRIDEQTKTTLRSLQCRRMAKVVLIAGEPADSDRPGAARTG